PAAVAIAAMVSPAAITGRSPGMDDDVAEIAFALALGRDALDGRERHVDDPPIVGRHRAEVDGLTGAPALLGGPPGQILQALDVPLAIAARIHHHDPTLVAANLDQDLAHEMLERIHHLPAAPDDPLGVVLAGALDLEEKALVLLARLHLRRDLHVGQDPGEERLRLT